MLLTTTPCSPGNCPGRSRPPSTTSSTRIGWLLIEVMTRLRISWIRRISSARRMAAAADGSLQRQHLVHGIQAAAKQADASRRHGDLALSDVVAAHGGVGVVQASPEAAASVMP